VSLLQRLTSSKRDADAKDSVAAPASVIKEWRRRHEDGSIGTVVALSDGGYVAGHYEYRARAGGIQVGPRYPYSTLSEAFAGADGDARQHGHTCSVACALWCEVTPSSSPGLGPI
jgi:hypothetical protein